MLVVSWMAGRLSVNRAGWRENLDVGWKDGTKYIIDVHDLLSAVG